MIDKYYYLIASLPYLEFEKPGRITKGAFLEECGKWLSERDYGVLASTDMLSHGEERTSLPVLREWKEFDGAIKEQIGLYREHRKKGEGGSAPEFAEEIFQQKNPLMMEMRFEKMRWDFLEEKSSAYFFDINYIVIYFLKLQIIARINSFDKDEGDNFFDKLCEGIYGQAEGQDRFGQREHDIGAVPGGHNTE